MKIHLILPILNLFSEHKLTLIPVNDGLRHRPRSSWSIVYLNTELCLAQVWLQSAMKDYTTFSDEEDRPQVRGKDKCSDKVLILALGL